MQKKWEFLNSGDKGHYKQKITRFKDELNKSKQRFRKAEDRFNTEENREKLNNFKANGTKEKFDSDVELSYSEAQRIYMAWMKNW